MTELESWDNWREHILAEIKRGNDNIILLTNAITGINVEIAKLQVKSGIWGVMGGMIPVCIVLVVKYLKI